MRVAVVAPRSVPEVFGGAERLYDGFVAAINADTEHQAELVTLPSPELSFGQLVDSYAAFAALDLSAYDHVISTKYPSWMVRHPSHSVYLLHTLRGLYDTYHYTGQPTSVRSTEPLVLALLATMRNRPGTPGIRRDVLRVAAQVVSTLGDDHPDLAFPGPLARALVHWLDHDALDPRYVVQHAAISNTVAHRPEYFPEGVIAVGLPCPTSLHGLRPGPFTTLFTASRLDAPKRIDLIIAAMGHVGPEVRLRIAGTGPEEARLHELAAGDDRITFLGRISESALIEEYAAAVAVPFVPLDEDMGMVSIEAHLAAKPVLTCTDSGGVTDLVRDGVDGYVVAPAAAALGVAVQRLFDEPALAEELGAAGKAAAEQISWGPVIDLLLPPFGNRPRLASEPPRARTRRKAIVLSTYGIHPAVHGGQLRVAGLARGLAESYDVEVLALDGGSARSSTITIAPDLRQTTVPPTEAYLDAERQLSDGAPVPVGDLAATLFAELVPDYEAAVRSAGESAAVAVLAHPYLLPSLLRACPGLPYVYDAHNAETAMKAGMFAGSAKSDYLSRVVRTVEQGAVRGAELVTYCSPDDRKRLQELGPTLAGWAAVPNGADVAGLPFVSGRRRQQRRERWLSAAAGIAGLANTQRVAAFVGSYHQPNLEAADRIVELAAELPQVAFVVVGGVGTHLRRGVPDNVVVTGMAPSHLLRSVLSVADVAINPMRSGGGSNLKLIEYFAAGAPVVSTMLGARGIDVLPGEHLLIADWADLGPAISMTFDDPAAADRRARQARALAETSYDWPVLARRLARALDAVVSVAR